jgi:Zn-finger nucleic acid-binding protein
VDKCLNCDGIFLDKGEIEAILHHEAGFIGRLLKAFQ